MLSAWNSETCLFMFSAPNSGPLAWRPGSAGKRTGRNSSPCVLTWVLVVFGEDEKVKILELVNCAISSFLLCVPWPFTWDSLNNWPPGPSTVLPMIGCTLRKYDLSFYAASLSALENTYRTIPLLGAPEMSKMDRVGGLYI